MRRTQVSVKNIPTFDPINAVGVDSSITAIRLKLAEISWLDRSFGRAYELRTTRKDEADFVFPAVMTGDGKDLVDILALDDHTSYSFMIPRGPETPVESVELSNDLDIFEREVDLIFWIDNNSTSETVEKKKNEVRNALHNVRFEGVGSLAILEIYDEPEDVFEGFSYEPSETQSLYPPYWGLRFRISLSYFNPCVDFDFTETGNLKRYYGLDTDGVLTDPEILALDNDSHTSNNITFSVIPVGQQKVVILYPESRGDLTSIRVNNFESINAFTKSVQSHDNGTVVENYNVYTSNQFFTVPSTISTI